jgi:hypothetical protein
MDNTTMTMNAATCVPSVRPRIAGPVRLAAALLMDQGTALSVAATTGVRVAPIGVGFKGQVSDQVRTVAPTYTTLDVARSRSGRPPV